MNKEIKRHYKIVSRELARIDKIIDDNAQVKQLMHLRSYHNSQVRNFQHERLIHLMVTIVFGAIMLCSWAGLLAWLIAVHGCYDTVAYLMISIAALLTILEIAYIHHYYGLENNTQKLYQLGEQIYTRLGAIDTDDD